MPFGWSPKVVYFRRAEEGEGNGGVANGGEGDVGKSKKDIYGVQISLFQYRLREIESSIRHYLEVLKSLEYRMVVFFDDSLRQQSELIVEKLSILHEKKAVIDEYIRQCERLRDAEDTVPTLSRAAGHEKKLFKDMAMFDHHIIVHNINLLWKKNVRNTVFKMLDLMSRSSAIKYCLSNAAVRVMKQLVAAERNDPSAIPLAPAMNGADPESASIYSGSGGKRGASVPVERMDAAMAEELLAKLIAEEETSFLVPNETEVTEATSPQHSPETASTSTYTTRTSYISSHDPESPDYVGEDEIVDANYIIQLVNPQINMEAGTKDNPEHLQSVVVAAESMQVQSVSIVDKDVGSKPVLDEYRDRNEEIIKLRTLWKIHNAQFLVVRKEDVNGRSDSDLDHIVMHRAAMGAGKGQAITNPWPVWAPLECLIDHASHTGCLQRVVERTSVSMHRDKPNPLYLKRKASGKNAVQSDTFHIDFPTFVISVNSEQYLVFFDVITALLVYKDPARGERSERLKKMLLALEQMDDLRRVQDSVLTLQDKIRQAEALLKYGTPTRGSLLSPRNSLISAAGDTRAAKNAEIRRSLVQYQDDLIVIIDALKELQSMERKRKSVGVAWQVFVGSGKLVWYMMLDGGQPLCQWTLDRTSFVWVHNEDQSSVTTLEIDEVHIENTMQTPGSFRDIVSAYVPDKRAVDFTRHKMLRVYLREMAPVAGIQVVDHFELNIFPLLFQMNYDTGKQLMFYIFPEKRARADAKVPTGPGSALSIDKLARHDSSEQMTVRSIRGVFGSDVGTPTSEKNLAVASDTASIHSVATSTAGYRRPSSVKPASDTVSLSGRTRAGTMDSTTGIRPRVVEGRSIGGMLLSRTEKEAKLNELKQMQARASQNRSFIYIKVPGVQHCLSYRGPKEKNLEDLYMFAFKMPTLEYRNKTWSWLDFLEALKKDASRAVLANTGALVRDKLFQKRKITGPEDVDTEGTPAFNIRRPSLQHSGRSAEDMTVLDAEDSPDAATPGSIVSPLGGDIDPSAAGDDSKESNAGRNRKKLFGKLFKGKKDRRGKDDGGDGDSSVGMSPPRLRSTFSSSSIASLAAQGGDGGSGTGAQEEAIGSAPGKSTSGLLSSFSEGSSILFSRSGLGGVGDTSGKSDKGRLLFGKLYVGPGVPEGGGSESGA
ncbi:hypothetical protein HK097_007555 [Rhizophlyctis rosea]|uniref:FMP27 WPPW motif-containing RBG unit domain-containing protein n=1 Tax=Rhizophlyctis rosea TaxID=64517 RepID=A0AAD5SBK4_9FUNG|nr:hypothetical protein HK097_007555 [Rhizophlyctis rosea]